MAIRIRRREFIVAISGVATAGPLAARAQQAAMPVIGFCHLISLEARREYLAYFHRGLAEIGYIEGRNVEIEYRWAYGQNDRLPILIAELVRRQVAVIVILESTHGALSAKAATQTIPIVFMQGADSVQIGLVRSLNQPGGNVTGFDLHLVETVAKRLELLHESVPTATSIAYLRNPTNPVYAQAEKTEVQAAARSLGVRLLLLDASNPNEVETAFANLVQQQARALLVGGDGLLNFTLQDQIVALAARHAIPAMYIVRETVKAGGLMSYGLDEYDGWRQAGVYTGRILKGERPVDLPVQRVTKVELALNLKTAKALGLTFPITLLGRADEVIE
jgi:putative tryptophan/tyrosine transport system substrate-binding protein